MHDSPVQSVRRPLPHLVAYGSTNKYRPVKNCKASGITAKRPSLELYFPCTTATPLTMTATVKAMDNQRWVCRTHLFQFNVTSSNTKDEPEAARFTTLEPPEAASWAFQSRTAWRIPRSAAASRTSSPRGRRCGRWEFR